MARTDCGPAPAHPGRPSAHSRARHRSGAGDLDVQNGPSRRVIEANGGLFEDERAGKLRYLIGVKPTTG
jgi:hypothetical protein